MPGGRFLIHGASGYVPYFFCAQVSATHIRRGVRFVLKKVVSQVSAKLVVDTRSGAVFKCSRIHKAGILCKGRRSCAVRVYRKGVGQVEPVIHLADLAARIYGQAAVKLVGLVNGVL